MPNPVNATNITPPRVPIIDERTGYMSREWYRWFYNLFVVTGGLNQNIIQPDHGGTGTATIPENGQLLIGNSVTHAYTVNDLNTGPGIAASTAPGFLSIENTGVLSNIAGSGIAIDHPTGDVTISNTGVLSFSGDSTGLTPATAATGAVTLGGVLNETHGGTNQSTYATGDTLYASATNTLSKLGKPSALSYMTMTSAGVPVWEKFAYGAFYDTTDQHDGSTTIPYAMRLNTTSYSNNVSIVARTVVSTSSIATTTLTCTAITSGRFYPGMILSGTGVTAGTYIYLQLSSTATAVATPTGSGGGAGVNTLTVSSATGLEARQFISGTNIPANTRIVDVSGTTVTLSANMTGAASGTYTVRPWGYQGTYSVNPSQTVASTTISGETDSQIQVALPGIYNIQFSAQFTNTDTSAHDVDIWFKKNDVTISDSNSQFTIPSSHGGTDGHLIAALNFFVELAANDVIEIVWHTANSAVYIQEIPAQTSPIRPATPSVIATVNMVAPI